MAFDPTILYEAQLRPDVPAGPQWEAWRVSLLGPEQFRALGGDGPVSEQQLAYLAAFGLLAPTSHNTVPQRFRLLPQASALEVWVDRERVLDESDSEGRQTGVSVGCVVANVELAAECFGLRVEVIIAATPPEHLRPAAKGGPRYVHLATLRFTASESASARPPGWLDLMRRRKMVRAEYDESVVLPPSLAQAITGEVASFHGLQLHLITDATTLLFLGKFQELAESTVLNREAFARELGAWLLPNDHASALGMRGREFGLSDEASRRFHAGLSGELQLLPDETAGFAKAANVGIRTSSAVGVITVTEDDLVHRIAAGRAYQRVALEVLRHDFVVSMLAAVTEVTAPNMALRGRLRTRSRPEIVFRVGRPRAPADLLRPHAARPTLRSVLLSENDAL